MRRLIFCIYLVVLFLGIVSSVYAANIEAVLDDTLGNSTFSVKDSTDTEVAHIDSKGNMLIKTVGILEGGTSPTYHTILQGGDQSDTITYTLPVNDGDANQCLSTNGSGVLSWAAPSYSETDPVVKLINGIVKSNGTTISAAVAGTDYQAPLGYTPENSANKNAASGYCPLDGSTLVPLTNIPATLTGKDADTLDTHHASYFQTALGYTPENSANKNAASGYCPLDASTLVPLANIPATLTGKDADTLDTHDASYFQAAGTYVTSVTGTSPITSGGGLTPAIGLTQTSITNLNSALATGLLKITTATGVLSTATVGTDYPSRAVTITVAASNSANKTQADYVCTGTSDEDTINTALSALPSTGGTVLLLEGLYSVDGSITVPSNANLEGQGYGTMIQIKTLPPYSAINVIRNSDTTNGNTNIRIANLHIDGSLTQGVATGAQKGIYFVKVTNSIVENNWVEHLGPVASCIGIDPVGATDIIIRNNIITDTVDGINTGSAANPCYRLVITGNVVNSTNKDYPYNLFYINDSVITNNIAREGYGHGIFFNTSASRNIIANNIVQNCSRAANNTNSGIYLSGADIIDNIITNNIVRNATSGNTQKYGIGIDASVTTGRNKIYNNDLYNSGTTADYYNGGTNTIAAGNITSSDNDKYLIQVPLSVSSGDIAAITAGKGFKIKEGTNARMGTATLSSGTVTVSNTSVTANTRIFLTVNGGTLTNVGTPYVSAMVVGTSFTITSTTVLDASTVAWLLVEPSS